MSPEEPAAPAQVPAAAPSLSFAAQLEGKMEAMASDPDSVQPTIVASMQITPPSTGTRPDQDETMPLRRMPRPPCALDCFCGLPLPCMLATFAIASSSRGKAVSHTATLVALAAAAAEEDEARKAAFAANRAAHYNMAAALRGHVSFEEEDEDDQGQDEACSQNAADDEEIPDDEDDAEGLSRKEKFAQKRKVSTLSLRHFSPHVLSPCAAIFLSASFRCTCASAGCVRALSARLRAREQA